VALWTRVTALPLPSLLLPASLLWPLLTEQKVSVGDQAIELLDGIALEDDAQIHGEHAGEEEVHDSGLGGREGGREGRKEGAKVSRCPTLLAKAYSTHLPY